MTTDSRPIWWRAAPGDAPADWATAFETLTSDPGADDWGLKAAIVIAKTRKRTGRGPSFSELFRALLPDDSELNPAWPPGTNASARFQTLRSFRRHVAIEWKRRGWINWDTNVERSLRTGRAFREQSRALRQQRTPEADIEATRDRRALLESVTAKYADGPPACTTAQELAIMREEWPE